MKRKTFTAMFFIGLASVLLLKLEAVNAQNAATRAIQNNGDEVVKHAPEIGGGIIALLTQNPVIILVFFVVILIFLFMPKDS